MYNIHMPCVAVLASGRLKVYIYHDDHGKPHVHIRGRGVEAKIDLESLAVIGGKGFSRKDLKRICKYIKENRELLLESYYEFQKD